MNTGNNEQGTGDNQNAGASANENAQKGDQHKGDNKSGIHNNALYAASMATAATAAVDPHDNSGLAQTGTNTSYEGPIGEGAGGSAGTGYTSGQSGTGSGISTATTDDAIGSTGGQDQQRQQADDAAGDDDGAR